MSNKLSISIRIGSRVYPISVSTEEEYILRKCARELDEKIKSHAHQFKVQDPQDLLAMVAFDLIVEQNKTAQLQNEQEQELIGKITQLQKILSEALQSDESIPQEKLNNETTSPNENSSPRV